MFISHAGLGALWKSKPEQRNSRKARLQEIELSLNEG